VKNWQFVQVLPGFLVCVFGVGGFGNILRGLGGGSAVRKFFQGLGKGLAENGNGDGCNGGLQQETTTCVGCAHGSLLLMGSVYGYLVEGK